MLSTAKATAVGTLRRSHAGQARRVLVWLAIVAAALAVATSAAFVIHRATTSGTTIPPATLTQQQATPQERAADPNKRLVQINDQPASNPAPAAPAVPAKHNRLIDQNG